jgi:hypothetical protein
MSKLLMARLALASATLRLLRGGKECVKNPVWLALIVAGPIMAAWPSPPQVPQSSFTPQAASAPAASAAQVTQAQPNQMPAAQQVSAPAVQPLQQTAAAPVAQTAMPVAGGPTAAATPGSVGLPSGAVVMQPSGSAPLRLPGSVLPPNSGADIQLVLPNQDQVQGGYGSGDFGVSRRAR